jgi:hypothetical protein
MWDLRFSRRWRQLRYSPGFWRRVDSSVIGVNRRLYTAPGPVTTQQMYVREMFYVKLTHTGCVLLGCDVFINCLFNDASTSPMIRRATTRSCWLSPSFRGKLPPPCLEKSVPTSRPMRLHNPEDNNRRFHQSDNTSQSHANRLHTQGKNVAVEWLALLLFILKMQSSNLVPESAHSDSSFPWFSSALPSKFWDSTWN